MKGAATEPMPHTTADGVKTVFVRALLGIRTQQYGAPVGAHFWGAGRSPALLRLRRMREPMPTGRGNPEGATP